MNEQLDSRPKISEGTLKCNSLLGQFLVRSAQNGEEMSVKWKIWDHDQQILRRCVVLMNLKRSISLGVGPVVHPNDGPAAPYLGV